MSITTFSDNLRRLRQEKRYTQEFVAEKLGVSPQSVSRWECGNTLPDVLLLPEIAKLYCVTVDDLFRSRPRAYENYARRLLAVFQSMGKTEDFAAAEKEFARAIACGEATGEDKLEFAYLYMKMAWLSNRSACRINEALLAEAGGDEELLRKAERQRIYFLAKTGKAEQVIAEQLEKLRFGIKSPDDVLGLMIAYHHSGRAAEGYEWFEKALEKYPDNARILAYGGNMCEQMGSTEDALRLWQRAYEKDSTLRDVLYSMAFCYEETGRADKARAMWSYMEKEFGAAGFDVEAVFAAGKSSAI